MERYFGGVASSDEVADRIVEDADRVVVKNEGEEWLGQEQHRLEDAMERDHRGEGVDDAF
jgi:hypothetical protein